MDFIVTLIVTRGRYVNGSRSPAMKEGGKFDEEVTLVSYMDIQSALG